MSSLLVCCTTPRSSRCEPTTATGAHNSTNPTSRKRQFCIRYHQPLRFYPDKEAGYEYPELYRYLFGEDYCAAAGTLRLLTRCSAISKWYMEPRLVTVNDFYSFNPNAIVTIKPCVDIVGRHFKQPKEGLGNDNSPAAHMWRAIAITRFPL